jgi:hypothetical protein
MRVITNEHRIKRGRRAGTILFFVSLLVLTGGLLFTNLLVLDTSLMLFVPCIIMPVGLVTTLASVRLTNRWVRTPRPEVVLTEGLVGIDKRSTLLNYMPLADHVLITPYGVYTLTTRFQTGSFKVEGDVWTDYKARGPLGPLFLFLRQENIGKPFEEAEQTAAKVQAAIDAALPDSAIPVEPIVVFLNDRATLELYGPTIPVVYASSKKPSLKGVLREDRKAKTKKPAPKGKGEAVPEEEDDFEPLTDYEIQTVEETIMAALTPAEKAMLEDVEVST